MAEQIVVDPSEVHSIEVDPSTVSAMPAPASSGSNWITDPLVGFGKGAASTVFHAGDLIRRAEVGIAHSLGVDPQQLPQGVRDFFGLDRVIDRPEVQQGITPSNTPQKVGAFLEHGAEFMVPAGLVGKATKGASLLTRALAEGGTAAGVAGLQSGGDPGAMTTAGAVGAGAPLAIAGTVAGVRALANASPEATALAKDLTGVVSPRLKHGLDVLSRLKNTLAERSGREVPAEAASATGPVAPSTYTMRFPNGPTPAPQPGQAPPVGYLFGDMPQATTAATEAAGPAIGELDDIALGVAGKKFSKLTAAEQETIRKIAEAAAKPKPGPQLVRPPVAEAPVEPPAPQATPQAAPAPEQVLNLPFKETPPKEFFEMRARVEKANSLADFLHQGGIPLADAKMMSPGDWKLAAQGAGVNAPSPATVQQALDRMSRLEKAIPIARQLRDVLAKPALVSEGSDLADQLQASLDALQKRKQ